MKKILALLMILSFLIIGCKNGCKSNKPGNPDGTDTSNVNLGELPDSVKTATQYDSVEVAVSKDSLLTSLTKEVFTIFKNKNYSKLDSLIHPEEGVRFSPYATVHAGEDKKFSREEFNKLITTGKTKAIKWGNYDGSGDPIKLTPDAYFRRFVYDANYVNPEKYGINDFIKTGNSANNLKEVYGGGNFTESYFSGSKKAGGMDWKSVRLVFKEINGKYYLVGVVHDQWTI